MKKTLLFISLLICLVAGNCIVSSKNTVKSESNSFLIYEKKEPDNATIALRALNRKKAKEGRTTTLEQKRVDIEKQIIKTPSNIKTKRDKIAGIQVEWLIPDGSPKNKVVFYVHGGGWSRGGLIYSRNLGTILARETGFKVLTLQYRLSPENPFPAALNDVEKVYNYLVKNYGSNTKISIVGDSAGGNLMFSLLNRLKNTNDKFPTAVVGVSPATDLTRDSQLFSSDSDSIHAIDKGKDINIIDQYVGKHDRKNPLISPLYGDLKGLPPMLIHVGGREDLIDDILAYASKANSQGVNVKCKIWRGMFHDFQLMDNASNISKQANKEIAQFLKQHLGN
ncbi:alpha/beta hydrolase [Gottfriedia luciferensis]|uniref:alpha/beta hydrolase n=1 Tax=Gottfriedia luciferensis TaxID=178774 RepID=UPI001302754A|nr:alpha/beta hydrolase [Gottfriedia luciferensis]